MKQWLLILWSVVLSGTLTAQGSGYYYVKNDGNISPKISFNTDGTAINAQLEIESFTTQSIDFNGNAEKIVFQDGISVMENGLPDIQHLSASVAVNLTGKIDLIIQNAEYTDYPFFNIAPSAGDPGIYPSNYLIPNDSIYNSDAFWPSKIAGLSEPYIMGNSRGVVIHFYPLQYNPVTHVLRVYHNIQVSIINILNETGINELTRQVSYNNLPLNRLVKTHFSNEVISDGSSRYTSINEEQGKMLIIAHPSFIETMRPFAEWKNQKGISCEIVDVTTIGNENNIKEFVSEYYFSKGLTYLLLVGDAAYVPSIQASKGLSDISYGYISGDDHYPEILVGRFPCETAEHCRIMVERTINYEKNPSAEADFDNFLGIGSGLGPGDDGEYDYEHIRKIGQLLNSSIYPDLTELYDGSRGGSDLDGNPGASNAADAIKGGKGAIMYIGHGSINSWLTTGFSTTNAYNLENTETHPFIWSAGCNSGAFNDATCLAEGFLRASKNGKPTGAIAALMSSASQTWYPPMEAQDEIALLLNNQQTIAPQTFGGISFSGCMKMNDKYGKGAYVITDNWILFGDPSVELRTASAKMFQPKYDTVIGSDASELKIQSLPEGSFVTASNNGVILGTSYAQNGEADLVFSGLNSIKSFTITITGKNYKPYIAEIIATELPSMAINPTPADHSLKVSNSTGFSWESASGCTPDSYIWNIRKKGEGQWKTVQIDDVNALPTQKLEYLTAYEWKVISSNEKGTTESKIFSFTTIEEPDEDFEEGSFPRNNWLNNQSWYVDNSEAYEGNFSLHSGSTVSRESSSLFYECETLSCDYISFWLKLNFQDQASGIGFYMDDFLVAEWNNTMNWTNFYYQIEPGTHKFEWRFSGSGDSLSVNSAAWIDNIYLPVNEALTVTYLSQEVCPSTQIQLSPSVSNYASLKWETKGTGHFDDPSRIDALYYPSDEDIMSGQIELNLIVKPNSVCNAESFSYIININQLPEFASLDDTTIYLGESLSFPLALNSVNQYVIYNDQSISSSMDLDFSKLVSGENTLTLIAENNNGCHGQKSISINYIPSSRPANRTLSVYPNPASEVVNILESSSSNLSTVNIYKPDGQLVGQYDFNGVEKASISVNHLEPGLYIISSENSGTVTTSKFIKI